MHWRVRKSNEGRGKHCRYNLSRLTCQPANLFVGRTPQTDGVASQVNYYAALFNALLTFSSPSSNSLSVGQPKPTRM